MNREQWAKEFFAVVDSRQPEKIATYMTATFDCRWRIWSPLSASIC